ncbi:GNAT family N-acetyltransferase [Siminovitchia acidinfaciens]|uniref:GNAT family N-acetyltransferase n=1 Tax=Siminovitchia acidinfaciens TaxID=2321395 RepID=A0A429Y685_9BACI|nr:bifunctional GNAT family N-acetyltransferase/carbon-nitrogen hydrolase family protein [Siminovitchia acidinfaciens]RST76950.1 GNAT family N-acetyltransferase [Siminovitchia acidinfaciens]
MSEADTSKYQKEIIVRNIREEDIEEVVKVANLSFGLPGVAFEAKHYKSHINIFPEGQFCVEYDGKIIGACSSIIINFDEYGDDHSFDEISGDGYIRNHNPKGINLYGLDVVVHPDYQKLKIGRRLYEARRKLCRQFNLKSILFGGRMPNYYKYADKMTPEEFVDQVVKKKLYDPVITFQTMNGFKFKKVLPKYLPHDEASLENATLMEWVNEDYAPPSDKDYRHSLPVRISSIQYDFKEVQSFEEFSRQCEYYVRNSSKVRSDFAVFPEAVTMQLASFSDERFPSGQAQKVTTYTEDYLQLFSDLAVKYSINIIAGSHYVEEDNEIYNVSYLFRRNGTFDSQCKLHITPSEKSWLGTQSGDDLKVFDTDYGKIAILIGYDILFPELARKAADEGAQIIFTPFLAENEQGYLRIRYCAQARAIENQVYTVISGASGNMTNVTLADARYGQSGIFSPIDYSFPNAGVVAESQPNMEAIVTGDVDLEVLHRNRQTGTVTPVNDRRIDRVRFIQKIT